MKTVTLTYFKDSGKFYTRGRYTSQLEFDFDVYKEVRVFREIGILPDLASGKWHGHILVEIEDGVPALILSDEVST